VSDGWDDAAENAAGYQRWVDRVRRTAPAGRLLEWQAQDGWDPLCRALGVAVPDEPFPSTNSSVEWAERRRRSEEGP
jgi:Sulfotransferase domain